MQAISKSGPYLLYRSQTYFQYQTIHLTLLKQSSVSDGTYSNELVRVVHHSDEHVQQHHQWDDIISAEHGGPNKLGKFMTSLHIGNIQIQQPKHRPEERLKSFKQPEKSKRERRK